MRTKIIFGECDACCKSNRVLHFVINFGCDTYACTECLGGEPADDLDDIEEEIALCLRGPSTPERRRRHAELMGALADAASQTVEG